jgi:Spy/CpxP family protein refolding chaperone
MRKRFAILGIIAALLLGGTLLLTTQSMAQAGRRARPGLQQGLLGMPGLDLMGPGNRAQLLRGFLLGRLDLTETQKEQIKNLLAAHRTAVEPYVIQTRDTAQALRDATAQGRFDEAQVRSLAQQLAQAGVERLVAAESLKADVYNNVLTPDQRTKLEELQQHARDRIGNR